MPMIRKVLVRDRSALVNQWLKNTNMPGSATLSATPSKNQST